MDTNQIIEEHSKTKLKLYELYLERYLSVLLAARKINQINIIDLFAGCGISDNHEDGSAVIAAKIIEKILKKQTGLRKKINLLLNEKEKQNFLRLEENIKNYQFASAERNSADEFIKKWEPATNLHILFFIDPYGYTQISNENLKKLFQTKKCDLLIFIPIFHIWRFLKPSDKNANIVKIQNYDLFGNNIKETKQVDNMQYYKPIEKFLNGLEIDKTSVITISDLDAFAELIQKALKKISKSDFVYFHMIENKENNNKYSLFFISHHILGAEKFLEAQDELIKQQNMENLLFTFLPDPSINLNFLKLNKPYDNVELYELCVSKGIRPQLLKDKIRELEKLNTGRITITALQGKTRNNRGLYIDYKHYKEKNRIISVTRSESRHVAIID
jgi:three-Cys-motif partner protein